MIARDQIVSIVDRILRLKEEAKGINADIREVYAEAKGNGYDKTALGKLVNYIEKRQTDSAKVEEADAIYELYLCAYDGKSGTRVATHTHEPPRTSPTGADAARPTGNTETGHENLQVAAEAASFTDETGLVNARAKAGQEGEEPSTKFTSTRSIGNVGDESPQSGADDVTSQPLAGSGVDEAGTLSPASEPPNKAADLPEGANASGLSQNRVEGTPLNDVKAEESVPQAEKLQVSSAASHSEPVRTRGKAERLPVPARDPHRFGSYKRTPEPEMPAFLRRGKVPPTADQVSENT